MPVSHLALSVSHLPSSTSFFLAALQPLGYQFIGQQGDSIGLGITEADFFLSQAKTGTHVSPTHIAFAADNTLKVRDCYAAALNAGGRPSGVPNYRQTGCDCFNAAVEDLDGNTVEFIWREPLVGESKTQVAAPSEYSTASTSRTSQKEYSRSEFKNDVQSVASQASRAKSRAQTALDLASTASKSMKKSDVPAPTIVRSNTEPVASTETSGGKAVVGTLLGAAFGAALAYATVKSERGSAWDEAAFTSSARSKAGRSKTSQEKSTVSKRSHLNYDAAESIRSSRQPPRSVPAIEAPSSHRDPEIEEVLSRVSRPAPQRSRTYDAIEYAPKSSTNGSERFSMKRASTLPNDMPHYYIEAPKSSSLRHLRRRSSLDDSGLKRHDSGVSMRSGRSSHSKASTAKPSRRRSSFDSAADIPLPQSRATSHIGGHTSRASKAPSYVSAAQKPLPQSRATSYISAAQVALPRSNINAGYTDYSEESDGLGDMPVLTPNDSISVVDFSKSKKKSGGSSKSSRHSSKRSEADSERTVRPAKQSESRHSAMTLPTRLKEDSYSSRTGRRSHATYT